MPARPELCAPIALVCAIGEEVRHLRAALPEGEETWQTGRPVWLTELGGQPIVLGLVGLGMVSAATATEAIIARYRPAAVLNCGCAGAHRTDLLPGDLVVGTRYVAYDSIRQDGDGTEHYARMRYLYRGEFRKVPFLDATPHLLESADRVAATLDGGHEPWPPAMGWPADIPHRAPRLVFGTVASADRWNRSTAKIASLVAAHDSVCEDMEAAAIAMTCAGHDVPFLAVKDILNNELVAPTVRGTPLWEDLADQLGRRAAALTLAILRDLIETSADRCRDGTISPTGGESPIRPQ